MALQGPLGFLQFFGRGHAITFALPSSLLNPITLKSSLFCTLPFPPFGKYYGNYAERVRQCLRANATQGPIVMVILCSCSDFVTNS